MLEELEVQILPKKFNLLELSLLLDISKNTILDWIEHDVIKAQIVQNDYIVLSDQITRIKIAKRLSYDLGINAPGISVIIEMKEHIKRLESNI